MDIQVTISKETDAIIKEVFEGLSQNEHDQDIKLFSELAIEIFSSWISGNKRFRSLTEQYIEWIEEIYTSILPVELQPKYDVLYNNFNMSPGQASYISRVLLEKKLVQWKKVAILELKKFLNSQYKKAKELVSKGETEVTFDITLSVLASNELKRISDTIRSSNDEFELPIAKGGYGSYKNFSIPAESLVSIKEEIDG
jgi:hypothetical protein